VNVRRAAAVTGQTITRDRTAIILGEIRNKQVLAKIKVFNTLRMGSFKFFKRPLPGFFLTILTL